MCGIAGIMETTTESRVSLEILQRMTRQLTHRGPDDEGYFIGSGVGLGHRRLSIIDLAGGHQPMGNEDGSVQVVFNGEIYNYQSLRDELVRKGHRVRTQSDTEVLVHLYEEEGPGCVERLRGMFAFAVWDAKRRRLVLARDRVGKKPLYYWHGPGRLVFGSEIKALLMHPDVPRAVNDEALHFFLSFSYVPSPLTSFREICCLPPACVAIYEADQLTITRYWQLTFEPRPARSWECLEEELESHMLEAVRLRLISDVPLGVLLSGGIDSSAVVALMRRVTSGDIQTFSIGFGEHDYNELAYARRVANRFGTTHHGFVVEPKALEVLPKLVWHYDQPCGDSSALATYYLAQVTRQHVTVALNGDGGDELFAGYDRYWALQLSEQLRFVPPQLLRASRQLLAWTTSHSKNGLAERWRRPVNFLEALERYRDPCQRYVRWMSCFSEPWASLYTEEFAQRIRSADPPAWLRQRIASSGAPTLVEKVMHADLLTYLPEDLLVKMDVSTMAHSLEARSPFLDHVLIEWSTKIPLEAKLHGWTTKYLLRRLLRDDMDGAILRRRKMGFGVPIGRWFRGAWQAYVSDLLLDPVSLGRGYFREEALRGLLEAHEAGKVDARFQLWALMSLELWHRQFIDQLSPVA